MKGYKFYMAITPGRTRMWSPSIATLWRVNEALQIEEETGEAISKLSKLNVKTVEELEKGGEAQPPAGAKS